jgi:hypothetical protein
MPEQPYSHLIKQISALAARVDVVDDFARTVVNYLADAFEVIRVALSIRPASNGPVIYHEAQSVTANRSKPRFLFSRTIAIRGVEYGRLEVESSHPVRDAVLALETIGQLVGLYAEERRLVEANAALALELAELEHALETAKVLARASGVVASVMGITRVSAEKWMEEEAARTRRSLHVIADRIILNQQAQQLRSGSFRRTA